MKAFYSCTLVGHLTLDEPYQLEQMEICVVFILRWIIISLPMLAANALVQAVILPQFPEYWDLGTTLLTHKNLNKWIFLLKAL